MNYCNKCGDPVEQNEKFCSKCGNPIVNNQNNTIPNINNNPNVIPNVSNQPINNYVDQNNNKKSIFIGVGVGIGVVVLIFLVSILFVNSNSKYFYNTKGYQPKNNGGEVQKPSTQKKGKYSTVIITDNTYIGVSINQDSDAYKLIEDDSVSQKNKCPSEIKKVEDEIIKKYGITAVNLCEMDVNFAREIGNVIKKIYEEYPSARGFITNLSLRNVSMSEGSTIAAFMPAFNFATSNSSSTYPWVIKTQVLLNTTFFLNPERLQAAVKDSSSAGHFPPNATIYSPIAHEFGHYLSFLAMLKHHKLNSILLVDNNNVNDFYDMYSDFVDGVFSLKMINEAFDNYKRDTATTMSLDEWRGTISKYALAKDNNGDYIWDETIAEAFHDVYLNEDKAKDASKYVVAVLKSKLEG